MANKTISDTAIEGALANLPPATQRFIAETSEGLNSPVTPHTIAGRDVAITAKNDRSAQALEAQAKALHHVGGGAQNAISGGEDIHQVSAQGDLPRNVPHPSAPALPNRR